MQEFTREDFLTTTKPSNHWQSPYFMPREAARIFLRVTAVRVERLQEITAKDAAAEGVDSVIEFRRGRRMNFAEKTNSTVIERFSRLWDSTIKPTDRAIYGWEADPWVWVIAFERITKEEAMKSE